MTRQEMDELGWDSCDIIIVSGDAFVDHPSFGMAVMGRFLESQGFRVGIIAQPEWTGDEAFKQLGKPNLFFGVSAGNMDSTEILEVLLKLTEGVETRINKILGNPPETRIDYKTFIARKGLRP